MFTKSLFWRQFTALFVKNFLIVRKHWLTNLLRCLIFPIAYGIFLAYTPRFFGKAPNLGLGTISPVLQIQDAFDGSRPLVWADNTNGTGFITAKAIMGQISKNFTLKQLNALKEVENTQQVQQACLLNFNGASGCFSTVTFETIPTTAGSDNRSVEYIIRYDDGVQHINIAKHDTDFETKLLAVQWAIDQAVIELSTGQQVALPMHLPYTHQLNDTSIFNSNRIVFLSLVGSFCGLAFILIFTGATYQLAGGVAIERATHLTSHLRAMGTLDSARILSWHLSISMLYLPAWILVGVIWHARLFINTPIGAIIGTHILSGLSHISWTFFVSVPFSKNPQLAAVVTTVLVLVLAVIPMELALLGTLVPAILSFFFPPMFYIFTLKVFAGFETWGDPFSVDVADPAYGVTLQPIMIASAFAIVLWPCLAVLWERLLYKIANPSNISFRRNEAQDAITIDPSLAISVRNVRKTFNTSMFRRKSKNVVAIADLSFDVPSYGIFALLGPNGAGKSTIMSIIGGLLGPTSGTITFAGNTAQPPRGTLGLVPQKNVLFPELTCLQTLRLWNEIKAVDGTSSEKALEQLIRDCDLESKVHAEAGTLSGGQKRKLQLTIGLVGGSKIILVDECTSGVDPLSRRALWKTLTTYRNERTIILTTHFLDEADFLADRIAVLASPGKLIACDTPVALKSTMGDGYSISVKFSTFQYTGNLYDAIKAVAPDTIMTDNDDGGFIYELKTKNLGTIAGAVRVTENSKARFGIVSYDVLGTTIEDIFLDLLAQEDNENPMNDAEKKIFETKVSDIKLSPSRPRSPWAQALTIFHKRALILRRSWVAPLIALFVGISGAWWPIRFISGGTTSCAHTAFDQEFFTSSYPPILSPASVLAAPLGLDATMNASLPELYIPQFSFQHAADNETSFDPFFPIVDQQTLLANVSANFTSFEMEGALSLDFGKNEFLVAYEVSLSGLGLFSIASNLMWKHVINTTSPANLPIAPRIAPSYARLPSMSSQSLQSLEWLSIFGAAMSIFPAFFTIYIANERQSSVQAMQLSNGLANPLGMWLGHLMFDSIFSVITATVIVIVYATVKEKFQGIGVLWLIICLYGWAGTLLSYVIVTFVASPLGAFAVSVISQFIIYLLYLTGYIVTLFSATPADIPKVMQTIHFTLALISPINSLMRAGLVTVNQFSLLCDGENLATGAALVSITRFGGPILYLVVWIIVLLLVLAQIDSRFIHLPRSKKSQRAAMSLDEKNGKNEKAFNPDVLAEAQHAMSPKTSDPLRILNVSKSYDGARVVDRVSFTIPHHALFVLLGPNGAGKTTTFDMIRGHIKPDSGDVKINETSVYEDLTKARVSFGVCPQFTAVDAHLTVREHLYIYGRFRGLAGDDLRNNIDSLLSATGLDAYENRLATKLSGGNQRKLALSIALIGNPPVVLVDEYSTGIDARMKRELWAVLKQVTSDKAVFLTTHSMEEASYLATKVGIMSKRMLAVGTPDELESRNASYEVHFSCHSREDLVKVKAVMARMPGARMVDDVATRFEVPIGQSDEATGLMSIASIFEVLSQEEDFPDFTVGKSTLETAFIKIINDDVASNREQQLLLGDDLAPAKKKRFFGLF
ncbi:P-loop containing nucleoside triphosphate hydrolase protein [Pholiota conissans]|uniref:P-loop containing nucleoside triphosphate hydrolase protein n=1 Tax=Pholiota conissans TaxID=109636 RepID=A0A9P6CUB8_9AGAR|nr:P-loop containing nucleoside triphosphate hydrolase protein [Pholiota conissans]